MRKITIVAAFIAGLLGLFMSICGGGFFVTMAVQSIQNFSRSDASQDQLYGVLIFLLIPGAFAVGGAALFWVCFKIIRGRSE